MRFRLRTLLIVLALGPPVLAAIGIAFLGLRQRPPSVTGRVTYRGMPADSATVVFSSQDEPGGASFSAVTDTAGAFRLSVDANRQPLRAGRYSVSISGQNLPTKYQVGVGLMCEVAAGKNEISLDLQ